MNILLNTDSYKHSHFLGYPNDISYVYSYMESRGGKYKDIVVVGITAVIDTIPKLTLSDIVEAEEFTKLHGVPFNKDWYTIFQDYGGDLPIEISGVAEGSIVSPGTPILSVINTDYRFPWLTSFMETMLLRSWYPITVASRVNAMKQKIKPYFDKYSDENMDFAILDFGSRGASSAETSALGGLGHLVHFKGSDNIPAVVLARDSYGEPMAAYSVAATEHSVMTAFGKEQETYSFEYLIENMAPKDGVLSVVADSWNVFEAAKKFANLVDKIKDKNVTLVFRPDSGLIQTVLPEVIEILLPAFGYTFNSKGAKVPNNLKFLWGDGINEDTVTHAYEIAEYYNIDPAAIMLGSGGGLLQANIDRDTAKFAFKASAVIKEDGTMVPIGKDPITDPGKASKKGVFDLPECYYDNGVRPYQPTLAEIRANVKN